MINIYCSSRYQINRLSIKDFTQTFLLEKGVDQTTTINLIFIGRNKMKKLSTSYKKEPVALPVLSFNYKETDANKEAPLGEVFICYPQAVLLAAQRNKTVEKIILDLVKHGVSNLIKN